MTPQEIISDDEIARVHGNANFGAMDPREVVNDGVRKTAVGYHCGSTQFHILRDHGLVTKPRPGSSDADLTKKGKAYARSIYRDTTPARAEAQDEGAAGEPVAWPETCDGIEQFAFEEWAKSEGFDMAEHPIDSLFIDHETSAARVAWKAGLLHAVERIKAAHPSPTPAADADRVRADRYYEALVQADLKIRSLPGTDQSDVEFIRAALKSTAAKEGGED